MSDKETTIYEKLTAWGLAGCPGRDIDQLARGILRGEVTDWSLVGLLQSVSYGLEKRFENSHLYPTNLSVMRLQVDAIRAITNSLSEVLNQSEVRQNEHAKS